MKPRDIFWAIVGLTLTVGLTQMEAGIYLPHWHQGLSLKLYVLNSRLQVCGLLLTSFLGGSMSGLLSQGIYLLLGLSGWGGLQVFGAGGGISYWKEPTFGYLIGFLPAAFLGGWVAFSRPASPDNFFRSGFLSLVVVHLCGTGYLVARYGRELSVLVSYWQTYSLQLIPAHLAILCSCSLIAYVVRLILLY